MKKTILSILLIIGVILVGYFLLQKQVPEQQVGTEYSDQSLGVSFMVPAGYVVDELVSNSGDVNLLKTITIMTQVDANQELPVGGESPAMIVVQIFKNDLKQFPLVWAEKNTQYSNINLKTSEISEVVVGGANAIGYTADGLYASNVFVVAHGGFMYVFSGQYIDSQSQIVNDFISILDSVKFIETQGQVISGKLDINTVCEGALAYMTFEDGVAADKFLQDCKDGKHPEVIEKFKSDMGLGDGVEI